MNYKRILLKMSGEALREDQQQSITPMRLTHYAKEIKSLHTHGFEVAVLIGGGNIYRGRDGKAIGLHHVQSDHIGMLATMINAVALAGKLSEMGAGVRLMSRLQIPSIADDYKTTKAHEALISGEILVLGGGTGVPCFTTDSAGALTAIELGADVLVKGTDVDGVYDNDPNQYPSSIYYKSLPLKEALEKKLGILDTTAMMLCLEYDMPIRVYNVMEKNRLFQVVQKGHGGTLLYP